MHCVCSCGTGGTEQESVVWVRDRGVLTLLAACTDRWIDMVWLCLKDRARALCVCRCGAGGTEQEGVAGGRSCSDLTRCKSVLTAGIDMVCA